MNAPMNWPVFPIRKTTIQAIMPSINKYNSLNNLILLHFLSTLDICIILVDCINFTRG